MHVAMYDFDAALLQSRYLFRIGGWPHQRSDWSVAFNETTANITAQETGGANNKIHSILLLFLCVCLFVYQDSLEPRPEFSMCTVSVSVHTTIPA